MKDEGWRSTSQQHSLPQVCSHAWLLWSNSDELFLAANWEHMGERRESVLYLQATIKHWLCYLNLTGLPIRLAQD